MNNKTIYFLTHKLWPSFPRPFSATNCVSRSRRKWRKPALSSNVRKQKSGTCEKALWFFAKFSHKIQSTESTIFSGQYSFSKGAKQFERERPRWHTSTPIRWDRLSQWSATCIPRHSSVPWKCPGVPRKISKYLKLLEFLAKTRKYLNVLGFWSEKRHKFRKLCRRKL